MGWFDSLTGGGDPDPDDGPDAYRVVRKTSKGGWKPVEDFDDMEEPIDKGTFEYNAAPLKPGEYRLFAVEGNLQTQPPEGEGWILEIDGDRRDDDQDDEIAEVKRELRALRESGGQEPQEPTDPQELVERQKASLQVAALQSEEFLRKHGDQIVLGMFDAPGAGDSSGGSAIGYEDWQDNPIGASLYETMNMMREDPDQVERLGEAIGRGVGTFVGGAADGYTTGADATMEQLKNGETPTQEQQDDVDPTETRDLDAGPADLSDLGGADVDDSTEQLAEELAETRTQMRRSGPGTQDRPDGAPDAATPPDDPDPEPSTEPEPTPDAEIDDADPMTAAPTEPAGTDTSSTGTDDDVAEDIAGAL